VARIAGVNIPTQKRVPIALTYIHGIGHTQANKICDKLGIPVSRRVNDLTEDEVVRIRETIDQDYTVEGGLRHRKGLPVRGQRTHTNARTRKGPAKAIAGKKKPGRK